VDVSQDITITNVEENNGVFSIQLERALKTGDPKDSEIVLDEGYNMIWAENTKTSELNFHTNYGFLTVYIGKDGKTSFTP
jgi:hypothetical protein